VVWTVEDITTSAKRRALIPSAQVTFQTADFTAIANEELQTYLVPLITSQREDYFIAHYDVTITGGTIQYRLPTRAVGQALRMAHLVDVQGMLQPFPRYAREALSGAPGGGFYLDGNVLQIATDNPDSVGQLGQSIRMTYFLRPNTLVASTAVGIVTNINAGAKQVTVGTAPGTFTSSALYDLVRGIPGFESLAIDQAATIAGNVLTFANALPSDLLVGDVVALAGQSNIPQVPPEAHPLLAQRVAVKCLEALGDAEQIQHAGAAMARQEADFVKLIAPRVAGNVERVINRRSVFRTIW
jgi:hypothetical protein